MISSIKAKSAIIHEIEKSITFGKDKDTIKKEILGKNDVLNPAVVEQIVNDTLENHGSYSLIQKVMRSKIVINIENDEIRIVDPLIKDFETVTQRVLNGLFDRKFNINDRKYYCKFEYRPFQDKILEKSSNGVFVYNQYQPPSWYKTKFYSEGKKKVKFPDDGMPEIYDKFFKHFTDNDMESYNYLLDWLANGVQDRNFTILTTVGVPGCGKGILGNIMRGIFGKHNYYSGSDRAFKGTFNSQLMHKRLVYIDEISITKKAEEDRLKLVVNDFLEVEKKGIDAVEVPNYANFYVSSNNMDSIRISGDDRRFSIINLTDVKLIEKFTDGEIKQLLTQKNINELASYLYYRKVDKHKMKKVFISERTQQVRESVRKEWEDFFITEYCIENIAKTLSCTKVSDDIEEKFGNKFRPSRAALQKLRETLPPGDRKFDVKKVLTDGKQVWSVVFS